MNLQPMYIPQRSGGHFKICTHKNFYGAFFLTGKKIPCHDEYEVLEEAIIMLSLDWNLLLVE